MKMNGRARLGTTLGGALTALAVTTMAGCLSRPVGTEPPTTKVNFTATLTQQQVDKVDLLFMIDNSASMADKQAILANAVPTLLGSLLRPKCVDPDSGAPEPSGSVADPNGNRRSRYGCPDGFEPEFSPVTDLHIGLISSSLGSFGGDVCPDGRARQNDRAHLLDLVPGGHLVEAGGSKFLSFYPDNEANQDKERHPEPPTPAIRTLDELQAHFQQLVIGVGQNGCGLEAQLESVYRFLVQPDPWKTVGLTADRRADLGAPDAIDVELLRQRADFLRPDSLVAIILLTDEDDSSVDPLSLEGGGWAFMADRFLDSPNARTNRRGPGESTTAPRATSACRTNPASEACNSCARACDPSTESCRRIKSDPECQKTNGYYTHEEEMLNVRFHRMKERFGVDPQYPIRRYVEGLTKQKVPDRTTEHPVVTREDGSRVIADYAGTPKCQNPLFAAKLPRGEGETCDLPQGPRTPELVFFAVVGGVPNELLHFDPEDEQASKLTEQDWVKILGRAPEAYDATGIDPHMVQSVAPRVGVPGPSDTRGDNGDPNAPVGRDWRTGGGDLQYACTFPLPTPRTCTSADGDCDCDSANLNPPLCGPNLGTQVRAKAYPTVRELRVVRDLGEQGIAASLCPLTLEGDPSSPRYGYNPAVKAVVDRLKDALTARCLPQKLTRDEATGEVPCLVLAQLAEGDTCGRHGLTAPPADILERFLADQRQSSGDGPIDLSKRDVCRVPQIAVAPGASCDTADAIGWCYVEPASGGEGESRRRPRCAQSILFSSASGAMRGASYALQCINQFQAPN